MLKAIGNTYENCMTLVYHGSHEKNIGKIDNSIVAVEYTKKSNCTDTLLDLSDERISETEKAELSENEKLEIFKKEIWKEINSWPRDCRVSESIQITDGAFKRMMTDKDFKNRMMKLMKEDADVGRPPIVCGITWIDENGYKGIAYNDYSMGNAAYSAHSKGKDSFYVKKAKNNEIQEAWEKSREKKKLQEKKQKKKHLESESLRNYFIHQDQIAQLYEDNIKDYVSRNI